ncbi:hypothetical protein HMPREF9140_01051 [Prevotella micans F0438]|jgi:hypothetical protein|uniref:Uncharacterized protein n=1 Tax=Prevotella micans F0438 TaxID=883158 RepID=H1Q2B3_9BACT|nr:hypothetical protein HMPREF9140_01051 [Prevotella micans F0438]
MLYTLKKYPLPEDLSIPIQIQSLQEKTIEVIDYDYIGDRLGYLPQYHRTRSTGSTWKSG